MDVCESAYLPSTCAVLWSHFMLPVHLKAFQTPVWMEELVPIIKVKGKDKGLLKHAMRPYVEVKVKLWSF